eukprot:195506-Prymnesium_polylepis.3
MPPPDGRAPGRPLASQASASRAFGAGLFLQILHRPTSFTIKAYDRYNRALKRGGAPFSVVIRGPAPTTPSLRDLDDGTYECQWEATVSGVYSIGVTLRCASCGREALVNPSRRLW